MAAYSSHVQDDSWEPWCILLQGPAGRQAVLMDMPQEMVDNGLGSTEAIPLSGGPTIGYTGTLWILCGCDIKLYAEQVYVDPAPSRRPLAMPLEYAWQRAALRRENEALARHALSTRLCCTVEVASTILSFAGQPIPDPTAALC